MVVLALRQSPYLPRDDLLFITRQYVNSDVSRAGIARLLKCEGMSRLEDVVPKAEGRSVFMIRRDLTARELHQFRGAEQKKSAARRFFFCGPTLGGSHWNSESERQ